MKGLTRRSQDPKHTEKLDPNSEEVEDLVSAVEFPYTTIPGEERGRHLQRILEEEEESVREKAEKEGAQHIEEVVYLDLDDGASTLVGHEVGEKEIEMEVDDDDDEVVNGDADGAEQAESGIKRKRTIRVIIRSRAFL